MKRKKILYIPLILLLIFILLLSACSKEKGEEKGYVTLSIDASSVERGYFLEKTKVELFGNETVFDVLFKTCKEMKIPLFSSGVSSARYIQGISDVYEFDHGPASGWVFYVNGESSTKSSGIYELEEGDDILWVYIIE